jgi:hypothetical protein
MSPDEIDVDAIRTKLVISQAQFAASARGVILAAVQRDQTREFQGALPEPTPDKEDRVWPHGWARLAGTC